MFCQAGACPFKDECDHRTFRAALVYAALGYAVYPASASSPAHHHSLGHFERGFGGWHLATTDLQKVKDWEETWLIPDVNIGIATGSLSRLISIDIDPKPLPVDTSSGSVSFAETVAVDPEPANSVRKWAADNGVSLAEAQQVISPTEGHVHLWFRIPDHWVDFIVPRRIGWFKDVDLLWDHHMTKAPPSQRMSTPKKVGGSYRFAQGHCPCQVPTASHELMTALYETKSTGQSSAGDAGLMTERVDADGMIEGGIPVGQQNEGLHRLACSFASRGQPPSDALKALAATISVSPQGDPDWPWTLDDLAGLVERAYAFISRDRGTWVNLASKIRF